MGENGVGGQDAQELTILVPVIVKTHRIPPLAAGPLIILLRSEPVVRRIVFVLSKTRSGIGPYFWQ